MTYTLCKIKKINEQSKLYHNEVIRKLLKVGHSDLVISTKPWSKFCARIDNISGTKSEAVHGADEKLVWMSENIFWGSILEIWIISVY